MNLFELFVKIGVDDQASEKLSNLSSKLGNGLKTAAKIGTAAVTAAATGIAALTTAAVNNYAEYEQLVGGAELMFGKAYGTVAKNAKDAYKTVQMSQNEYLKQANGFATGLKTALGGNEEAAADLAHRIIQAEADIVAATGNTQENVANAFNGIMKSNFTMLDNLQIGITPTKEGFQEVIDKVNEWNKANGEATDYQMGNLADMQSALVDYIEMQGYAGYASREAANTISGSVASMKAAWTNLLTGFADGNADLEKLTNDLVTTIVGDGTENNLGVLGNILPAVETALGGVAKLIEEGVPKLAKKLPSLVSKILPSLISAAVGLVNALVEALPELINTLVNALVENAPLLIESALMLITTLINGLLGQLPKIAKLGLDLIIELANGIADNLDELIPAVIETIKKLVETLTNPESLSKLLDAALNLILTLAEGLLSEESINGLIDAAFQLIDNLITFLTDPENILKLVNAAIDLVVAIAKGLIQAVSRIEEKTKELIGKIKKKFKETDWLQLGKDIVNGIWDGIKELWPKLVNWFSEKWDNLVSGVKDFLGLGSSSVAASSPNKTISSEEAASSINSSIKRVGSESGNNSYNNTSVGTVNINISGVENSDPEYLADVVANRLTQRMLTQEAVYG